MINEKNITQDIHSDGRKWYLKWPKIAIERHVSVDFRRFTTFTTVYGTILLDLGRKNLSKTRHIEIFI